jgi:type VI secretion system protein ImpA
MGEPLLDFDALIAPVDGEQPAGFRLPADVRKKMEDARKEFEPNPDDPSAPPIPKKPDWPAIVRLATDSLASKSKDLLGAVRLTEALAKRDGFAGLRDGLKLLRLYMTECWDRVHPLIEEPDDIEARAGPFEWLNEAEGGAWFPAALRKIPVVVVGGKPVCLQNVQDGKLDEDPLPAEALRTATPVSETITAEVGDCVQELDTLDQALSEKMAEHAPSLINVRDVLHTAQNLLSHLQGPAGELAGAADGAMAGNGAPTAAGGVAARPGVLNRAETYRQISMLADHLGTLEPHSPIPDLLRWAVKLGSMPFRQLIKELVREESVLAEIRRQFGIPEEQQESSD